MLIERIKNLFRNTNNISDGWHTFEELYKMRHALFILIALFYKDVSYKTRLHSDGSSYDGYFLLVSNLPTGQVSFHMPDSYWDMCPVKIEDRSMDYDGHTTLDVYYRLIKLVEYVGKNENLGL